MKLYIFIIILIFLCICLLSKGCMNLYETFSISSQNIKISDTLPLNTTNCEIDPVPDPCVPNPCQNSGTCNNGTCNCTGGYTGVHCEIDPDPQNFCDCSILRDVIVSDVNTANYDYSLTNYLYSDNGKDYISWCKDTIRSDTEYYRYNCTTKSVNNCTNTKYCKMTNLQPPKNLNLDKKKEINLSKLDLDPNNTVLYIGYVSDDGSTTWDKNINSQPWNHLVEDENILTVLNDLYNNGYIIHIKVYKSSDNNYNIIFDIESSIIGKVIHWRFYNEYNEVLGNISSIKDTITYNITYNNPDSNIVDHIEIIELK